MSENSTVKIEPAAPWPPAPSTVDRAPLRGDASTLVPEVRAQLRCPICTRGVDACSWLRDVIDHRRVGWHDRPIILRPDPEALAQLGPNVLLTNPSGRVRPRLFHDDEAEGSEMWSRLVEPAVSRSIRASIGLVERQEATPTVKDSDT